MALTDRRMAQLGRQYKDAIQQEKDAKEVKSRVTNKIITELNRRGTKSLDSNNVKVTRIDPTETVYDWDQLAAALTVRQLRRIQSRSVDRQLLAEEIQAGRIDPALVAQCTTIDKKSSYISVVLK